ncbi:hypothetical protein [Acidovorax cavernicola]|uniref:Transmembrane protein n=1 Tax=Acidovorax cavernicola TaxID=1675792 RepID=A0A9X8D8Q9_9BURK|nr:hypothetical protein [Acidovorax cavernicola]RIX84757.1 hypothetical protein D3H34_03815 [Acidovorax cavernicola]
MIVPKFWAEGRIQERVAGDQVTVRRFGWSDDSPLAAQAHADQRTREAFDRVVRGEKLERREPKRAYNGADGVPIREEIVERQGDSVITRNGYGARCLNTPDVLFVDVDFEEGPNGSPLFSVIGAALIGAIVAAYAVKSWIAVLVTFVAVLAFGLWRIRVDKVKVAPAPKDPLQAVRGRIERFIHQHPDWHLRLYRTPAGLRVLAMHDVFAPSDPAVVDAFQVLGADKVYARMCRNQNCFRARLSAKPWRVGIGEHLRPRPGVWPVSPDRLPARDAWVARYESAAKGYAACEYLESVGNTMKVHLNALAVQELHDERAGATSGFPLA